MTTLSSTFKSSIPVLLIRPPKIIMGSPSSNISSEEAVTSNIQDQVSRLFLTSVSCKTSAEKITRNEVLLSEILLGLPVRSLVRFKCVSKPWLCLISSSHFCYTHTSRNSRSLSAVGLFFANPGWPFPSVSCIIPIPLPNKHTIEDGDLHPSPAPALEFLVNLRVIQSCKGLVLCTSSNPLAAITVCNPTTKKFSALPPPPPLAGLISSSRPLLNLAYDPLRSLHYVVVRVLEVSDPLGHLNTSHSLDPSHVYRIQLFSSQTQTWSTLECPLRATFSTVCDDGVFCNGSIYWLCSENNLIHLDVGNRCFETMITGFLSRESLPTQRQCYFGECKGKLYLVEEGVCPETYFVVYEMGNNFSEWLLKYTVHLRDGGAGHKLCSSSLCCSRYSIPGLVGGHDDDDDDEALGMLILCGDLLFCDFNERTPTLLLVDLEELSPFVKLVHKVAHQYVENLSPV